MANVPFRDLCEKYMQGTTTAPELEMLRLYLSQPEYKDEFDIFLQEAFCNPAYIEKNGYDIEEVVQDLLLQLTTTHQPVAPVRRGFFRRWGWVAASLLILIVTTVYFLQGLQKDDLPDKPKNLVVTGEDLPPGADGAMLTLSDGRTVLLDSLGNGVVASESSADVVLSNGRLSYAQRAGEKQETVYNQMQTPRGRQFQLSLPDGSKVWLNAASSIRFPVSFTGPERKVEITGEAYFEVNKVANKPFVVNGRSFRIEVLGTGFNVNSYADNGLVKTTLVEGAVKVASASSNEGKVLKPGQQWVYDEVKAAEKLLQPIDISEVTAWKNKRFSFNGTIREVMNEIARWYDVELKYEGNIPVRTLEGGFTREIELQKVLEILHTVAGVSFELDGRTLLVKAAK